MRVHAGRPRVVHLAAFDRNVGDNALNEAIGRMLAPIADIERLELVGNPFDRQTWERMNAADAVIFGGGGVIHSCSGGASRKNRERTGTMWNMDLSLIRDLRCKIILYSVGFNRFDGEPAPLRRMGEFFELLNEKRALVSFRNDGSKARFLDYFPQFEGLAVTPDPGMFCRGEPLPGAGETALLQIATDRLAFRYPGGIDRFVSLINEMRPAFPQRLVLIPHTAADAKVYHQIAGALKVDEILPLRIGFDEVGWAMDQYRNAAFSISTRGHSQICSVGNFCPTFAVSTHPKARGFMEDIGQGAACFDYLTEDRAACAPRFAAFLARLPEIRRELERVNVDAEARIGAFNARIVAFLHGEHVPPPFLTAPGAAPRLAAALLEESAAPVVAPLPHVANEPPPARVADKVKGRKKVQGENRRRAEDSADAIAYLPGGGDPVGPGTYRAPARAAAEPVAPLSGLKRRRSLAGPLRTADGARCGVVVSCDANYFVGVETCIRALRRYNPRLPVTFLDAGLTQTQAAAIRDAVDHYACIEPLLALDVATFPSHLSKAALSSLYVRLAPYDKTLYLDVDALVLDDLTPVFEALDAQTDIAGVRGNLFGALKDGVRHTVAAEMTPEGATLIRRMFPGADLDAPAINSGCFAVWRRVADLWAPLAESLYPYLRHFRTADQALLNLMISMRPLRLKLLDPMYNVMGLQVGARVHPVQEMMISAQIDADFCALSLGDRRVRVAHFAGRTKPWMATARGAGVNAWNWHGASNAAGRRRAAALEAVAVAGSSSALTAVAAIAPRRGRATVEVAIEMGHAALRQGLYDAAFDSFARAAALRPASLAATRGLLATGPRAGRLAETAALLDATPVLRGRKAAGDRSLVVARATLGRVLAGQDAPPAGDRHARPEAIIAHARALARGGDPAAAAAAVAAMGPALRSLADAILLSGTVMDDAAAAAHVRLLTDGALTRRIADVARRVAQRRLAAMHTGLGSVPEQGPRGGLAAQVGAGFGPFLAGLAVRLGVEPLSIDALARARFLDYPAEVVAPEQSVARIQDSGGLSVLVLAHVADRLRGFAEVAQSLASALAPGALMIIIDDLGSDSSLDCIEGLQMTPPVAPVPAVAALGVALAPAGLALEGAWCEEGERILAFRRDGRPAAPDQAADGFARLAPIAAMFAAAMARAETIDGLRAGVVDHPGSATAATERAAAAAVPSAPIDGDGASAPGRGGGAIVPAPMTSDAPQTWVAHVAHWRSPNLGDIALAAETRAVFEDAFPTLRFVESDLNACVAPNDVRRLNASRFVLIGGALVHSTACYNAALLWNLDHKMLKALEAPLVLFGIGLNDFCCGALYESAAFREMIDEVGEHALFMGFRERRAYEIVRAATPRHAAKVFYQPCPTLLLSARYPFLNLPRRPPPGRPRAGHVAINIAFDHSSRRYGDGFSRTMADLRRLVATLRADGCRVTVVGHCQEDMLFHALLPDAVEVAMMNLTGADVQRAAAFYAGVDLAIGMRTHAQLFPFALGTPILSLISHEKVAWALDDLDVRSWGVEIGDVEFLDKALAVARDILAHPDAARRRVIDRRAALFAQTESNLQQIKRTLPPTAPALARRKP